MDFQDFVCNLKWSDIPCEVQNQSKRCLADIIATAAGSTLLPLSDKGMALIKHQYGNGGVPLWFKQAKSSFVGASYYNALAIDSLDFHDGFRPCKGHAGATVSPVAIGACSGRSIRGETLLTALVIGYEIACRAGLAIHSLYCPAYHSSGSWASLGAAAAAAHIFNVPTDQIDGILGMAEYYAPMSPILRCTVYPGAVKDGAAVGAWAAAMAIEMYSCGMSGIPSVFTVESVGQQTLSSLGQDWIIMKQYFKAYPTCRWTQPAVECILHLRRKHHFCYTDIDSIELEMFEEGATLGKKRYPPENSDVAQYSIAWAVAALLVDGKLGVDQILPERLLSKEIIDLGLKVKTTVVEDLQRRFPQECLTRTTIVLKDGRILKSPTMGARGDYTKPLSDMELQEKFESTVAQAIGQDRCMKLKGIVTQLEKHSVDDLLELFV